MLICFCFACVLCFCFAQLLCYCITHCYIVLVLVVVPLLHYVHSCHRRLTKLSWCSLSLHCWVLLVLIIILLLHFIDARHRHLIMFCWCLLLASCCVVVLYQCLSNFPCYVILMLFMAPCCALLVFVVVTLLGFIRVHCHCLTVLC